MSKQYTADKATGQVTNDDSGTPLNLHAALNLVNDWEAGVYADVLLFLAAMKTQAESDLSDATYPDLTFDDVNTWTQQKKDDIQDNFDALNDQVKHNYCIYGIVPQYIRIDYFPGGVEEDAGCKAWIRPAKVIASSDALADKSKEAIEARIMPSNKACGLFAGWLNKYIDKFDKFDKATFVGFNAHFDETFMRSWMRMHNNSKFSIYGSYFFSGRIDVLSDVAKAMASHRAKMPSIKLELSCQHFDIELDGAHDALADIYATRDLFYKLNPHLRIKQTS